MRHRLANFDLIPEAEIVSLCDPDSAQLVQTIERYPKFSGASQFNSHVEMIASGGIDAVLIATPHVYHAIQIEDALKSGLHVLCEKPLVASVSEAVHVMAVQRSSGKVGMVAYQRHFQPEFRYIHDRIKRGEVGKVQFVSALLAQAWKKFTEGTWRQIPELSCGGMLNDSGSHMMDAIMWTTGLEVNAVSAHQVNRGTPVDINSAVALRFDNGALGTISVVGDAQEWHEEFTIWCDEGTFYIRDGKLSSVDRNGNKTQVESLDEGSSVDKHFVDCILGRTENEAPFECAMRVVQLTEAAAQSASKGGAVVPV